MKDIAVMAIKSVYGSIDDDKKDNSFEVLKYNNRYLVLII